VSVRILVVDDQHLVRQGIVGLLGLVTDFCVVGEAADGDEALARIRALPPDVVLLDVRMPGKSGLDVLAELRTLPDAPGVILLTTFDDDAVALEGVRLGARGFLLKDVTLQQLETAIRTVAAGGTMINPAVTQRVLRGLERLGARFDASELPETLTPREKDVLRLVASGSSNREIADALGMAEGTVKNHASSIFAKLGVRDRTRAVLRAIELGYL